jgi:hypothetical protein
MREPVAPVVIFGDPTVGLVATDHNAHDGAPSLTAKTGFSFKYCGLEMRQRSYLKKAIVM